MEKCIVIRGCRTHNLQAVDLDIPLQRITAVVGVAGAGKSSLAFATLHAEAYLRYIESLSPYVRQFLDRVEKPDVDCIENLPPALAFRQRVPTRNPRSIVATAADLHDYLRILFAKLATFHCPECGHAVRRTTADEMVAEVQAWGKGLLRILFEYKGEPAWLLSRGFRFTWQGGEKKRITEASKIKKGAQVLVDEVDNSEGNRSRIYEAVEQSLGLGGEVAIFHLEGRELRLASGWLCPNCRHAYRQPDEGLFSFTSRQGACPTCKGLGGGATAPGGEPCPACRGTRLQPQALAFRIEGKSLPDFLHFSVAEASEFMARLDPALCLRWLPPEVIGTIRARLEFLMASRLHYLRLDRPSSSLSRGEQGRIGLAFVLGAEIADTLIVLDQPSAGLHPRELDGLRERLARQKSQGNTVILVDHHPGMMEAADHVVLMGPGPGRGGGRVLFSGSRSDFFAGQDAARSEWLGHFPEFRPQHRTPADWIDFPRAESIHLKGFTFRIPRQALTVITGVCGAGKSTLLLREILPRMKRVGGFSKVALFEPGRGRGNGNVATFFGLFSPLREFFASLRQSRLLHYLPAHFSFYTTQGRCPECHGRGELEVGMQFLPPLIVRCGTCQGSGFSPEILRVTHGGRSIAEILSLTVKQWQELLVEEIPPLRPILEKLVAMELGYLLPGQRLEHLSAGEWQKIGLCRVLGEARRGSLILLDEPSLALHPRDVHDVRCRLEAKIAGGDTVVLADHQPLFLEMADQVLELGPAGGEGGGFLLFSGSVKEYRDYQRKS